MSDMFRNYDYIIEKPLQKKVATLNSALTTETGATWLKNICGKTLGIKANSQSGFTLYISFEVSEDSELINAFLKTNSITCEFLDTDYEIVLSKPANLIHLGLLEVQVGPNELSTDNYYLKITATELPSDSEDPDPEPGEGSDSEIPDYSEDSCEYLCKTCGCCTLDSCVNQAKTKNLVLDIEESGTVEVPELPCIGLDNKCTCNTAEDDSQEEPVIKDSIYNHYYWWGCDHDKINIEQTDLTDSGQDQEPDSESAVELKTSMLYLAKDFIISVC